MKNFISNLFARIFSRVPSFSSLQVFFGIRMMPGFQYSPVFLIIRDSNILIKDSRKNSSKEFLKGIPKLIKKIVKRKSKYHERFEQFRPHHQAKMKILYQKCISRIQNIHVQILECIKFKNHPHTHEIHFIFILLYSM